MQVISQNPQMTQGPPIIQQVAVHAPPSNVHQNYRHQQALGLGITQLVLGMLCMSFQIFAIVYYANGAFVSAGIWSGIVFLLTGIFEIVSARQKTTAWIVLTMVMSILSSLFTLSIIIISAIGISYDRYCHWDWSSGGNYYCMYHYYRSEQLAFNGVLIALAVMELVVSIWASAICCSTCCCGRKSTTDMITLANPGFQGTVQYLQPIQVQPTIVMNPGEPNITYTIQQGYNQQSVQPVMIIPSQQMAANITHDQTVRPPGYDTLAPVHGNQPYTWGAVASNQVAPEPLPEEKQEF